MNNKTSSIITSLHHNGMFKTLMILKDLMFIKLGFSKHVKAIKGIKIELRKKTSDTPVFRQIFMDLEYDFNIPFNPKNIVDAGANIGLFSVYLNQKHPNAKYFCLEPEQKNFNQLKTNTKHIKNINLLQKALWNNNEGVTIEYSEKYGEWGFQTKKTNDKNLKRIESTTITELMDYFNIGTIDILKIDVEGAEQKIFEENTEWLKRVRLLIIELHDYIIPNSSNNFFKNINQMLPFSFFEKGENLIFINNELS